MTRTATLIVDAPVFATTDANQSPLRLGKTGSVLQLVSVDGDWCRVEFEDPEVGRRLGYVQLKFVRVANEALDLSAAQRQAVPQSPTTVQPRQTLAPSSVYPSIDDGKGMIWSGVALMAAGTTLAILANTTLKNEAAACVIGVYAEACAAETSTNKPVLITGVALSAVGGVIFDLGLNRHQRASANITFGPKRLLVTKSFSF
jgi:hypothetical protein